MIKINRITILQVVLLLVVVFITTGNYHSPAGSILPKEAKPNFPPPPGYSEYTTELEKYKHAGYNKLGQLNKGYRFGPMGVCDVIFDTTGWDNSNGSEKGLERSVLTIYGLYIKKNSKLNNAGYVVKKAQPFTFKNDQLEALPFYLDVVGQQRNKEDNNIVLMFPVSKTTRVLLIIAWGICLAVGAFCLLSIFLGGLIRLIREIAQGRVFNEVNIRILKNICYISFGVPLLYLTLNILLWVYVQVVFPGGLGLAPQLYFTTGRFLLIGIFFYALYHAFKKGFAIQQESELTI